MKSKHAMPPVQTLTLALILVLAGSVASAAPDRLMLTIGKQPGGDLTLAWQDSCPGFAPSTPASRDAWLQKNVTPSF